MSLYKDASLVMIPSAYKDGKLYSIRPTDGDGDFTFSRGSNLAATRVDVNGLIEKGRENVLLQSNQFDTSANWVNTSSSETSGQSGYDGSSDAWLLTKTDASGRIHQNFTASGVMTYSVYLKANASNYALIQLNGSGADKYMYIDLTNGTKGSLGGGNIDENIVDVGNGWYRCSITANTNATRVRIYPANSTGDVSATSGSIYIQDAQLEQGLVATDYIETGASTAQAGILEDMPRLDYSGGASCPSLLLEPQRSNALADSEYFGGWSNVTADVTLELISSGAPDGGAFYRCTSGASGSGRIVRTYTGSMSGAIYSIYAKGSGSIQINLWVTGGSNTFVDVALTSEWKRYDVYNPQVGAGGDAAVWFYPNGVADIWGAQVESGSYPTSYIPTYGTSQTRSGDNMGTTFSSSLTSGGEVSVLFDIDGAYNSDLNSTGDNLAFIFSNDDRIIYNQNANGFHRIEINVAGRTEYIYLATSVDRVDRAKICIVVTASTYAMYVNGTLERSGSFTGTGNWTSADSFNNSMTDAIAVVPMKQLLYFPTALTSSEAIALTTL